MALQTLTLQAFLALRNINQLPPDTVVTVICRVPGMRRNGVRHSASETYPFDHWTPEELAIFEADPAFALSFDAAAVAAGADTADAIRDNGAGAPQPDLGAKPDGTGPSAAVVTPEGDVRPPVVANERVEAIRAVLGLLTAEEMTQAGEPRLDALEKRLGFKPTRADVEAAEGAPAAVA